MADEEEINYDNITPKWRRKGTVKWLADDEIEEDLVKGTYLIEFKPLRGYKTPPDMEVYIHENTCLKIDVTYLKAHVTGKAQITILPDSEVVKDVKWRAMGTDTWYSSGEIQEGLVPGIYDIEFLETEFCTAPTPLKISIIENYTTKATYTVIITGTPAPILEEVGVRDVNDLEFDKRVPKDKYTVTISGGSGYVLPETLEVPYGEKATFNITGSYVFGKDGIKEFFTPHGPVDSLTDTQLITGMILNDAEYSFNLLWIDSIKEDVGITSPNVTKAKIYNKKSIDEEIGFKDINYVTARKRKPYIDKSGVILDEVGFLSIGELTFNKRTPILSESLEDSPVIDSGILLSITKTKKFKEDTFIEEEVIMTDIIVSVTIRDSIKHALQIKEEEVVMTDLILNVNKKVRYKTDDVNEEVGFISPEIMGMTKKDNYLVKPTFRPSEDIAFTAPSEPEFFKSNTSLQRTDSSIDEEIGFKDINETELTLTVRLKTADLNEEIGITDINFVEVTKKSKLKNNTSLEEIGIVSNTEFEVTITNKYPKIESLEEVGITACTIQDFFKENKSLNRNTTELEEIALTSSSLSEIIISDSRIYKTKLDIEEIGFTDITSIDMKKYNPKLKHVEKSLEEVATTSPVMESVDIRKALTPNNSTVENFIASDVVYSVTIKSNLKPYTMQSEPVLMSDMDFTCTIKSHLIESSFNEELGINDIHSIEVYRKSHLLKTTIIPEVGITSISELELTKTNKEIDNELEVEEVGITSITELEVSIT